MKKTLLSGFVATVFALNPLLASAAANDKYPAANFEPSVIYIDKDAVAEEPAAVEFDPKYPAANFESKVVYIDQDLVEQTEDKFDPKYPAAYFKPKVIFP
ncbi:MAG: hypothetical protein Q7U57_11165 [Methylovulum sp.]|nr:hypothetical protein [Methylovulum sp.]